jgi:uncharacterized membrane protein
MDSMEAAFEEAGILPDNFGTDGQRRSGSRNTLINIGDTERLVTGIGGGLLAGYGLSRGSLGGVALALAGGVLAYRASTGHCNVYEAAGINTARNSNPNVSVKGGSGIKVENKITVNKPRGEVFRFWRNFENLPRFMNHVEAVHVTGAGRSHWVVKGPAGTSVEWDAEIYNEKENELIAWRSVGHAAVNNAGSVHFDPTPDGTGTVISVSLKYDPPGGTVGAGIARLFGENPEQQIEQDLHRLKQVLESGEFANNSGQVGKSSAAKG